MAGGAHRYRAPDFDTLVDSPIVIGNPAVYDFAVDGKTHYLVNVGEAGVFDGARAARGSSKRSSASTGASGARCRTTRYVFLNMLTSVPGQIPGGGLEHKNSTVLMTSRWATRTRRAYLAWLELVSHEFFHAWNVQAAAPGGARPVRLREREPHAQPLDRRRASPTTTPSCSCTAPGCHSESEYLDELSNKIEELQTTPGRGVQSVELASFDAWIKYYRPDENSTNASISYYTKGAVIAFLLDAKIRKATGGARSLDDVMRAAYQKFSGARGYTPEEFRAVAEQVAGRRPRCVLGGAVCRVRSSSTTRRRWRRSACGSSRCGADRPARAWLGMTTRNDDGRLVVSQVRRGTPAHAAGLERRRRDPRDRRLPRACRSAQCAARAVQARRHSRRCSSRVATS